MWKTKNGETGSGLAFALPCKVKICADSVKVYTGAGWIPLKDIVINEGEKR